MQLQSGRIQCYRRSDRQSIGGWLLIASAFMFSLAGGQDAGPTDPSAAPPTNEPWSRLIRVPLPIVGSNDTELKRAIAEIIEQAPPQGRPRPVLVLEFWPTDPDGGGTGTEFERALSVASFLASDRLSGVRTVAFLPRTVRGHAVLPVLACEQIIMHPDAELGDAGADEDAVDNIMRDAYREIANRRRTIVPAVAEGMLDPDLTVLRATTPAGVRYILSNEQAELESETTIEELDTIVPAGSYGRFSARDLRLNHGFVSHLVQNRRALARELGLRAADLESDPSLGKKWQAVQVKIRAINEKVAARLERGITNSLDNPNVNLVIVVIESPGGDPTASANLANFLAGLDNSEIRTVAYVESAAHSDAVLLALACDQIVMAEDATLGGEGPHTPSDNELGDLQRQVRELATAKSRGWSLPAAMIDPHLEVHRYTLAGTSVAEYFCEDELLQQSDPRRWQQGELQTEPGKCLLLTGSRAADLRLARYTAENFDEVRQLYHLDEVPASVEPTWVENLVDTLASPEMAGTLLFIAGFAVIFELSAPGLGAGGFIAAVCFALFFWSKCLNQTAGWLELILFATGASCLVVEVFVTPGIGVFGIGGGILIVLSLVLASQTFIIPRNEYELAEFNKSLIVVAAVFAGGILGVALLRNHLGKLPFLRRLMLTPPAEDVVRGTAAGRWEHLLDQTGVTTTRLTPAGKARFGDDIVDVVSDGDPVDQNEPIRVIDVMGNRIVVQASQG